MDSRFMLRALELAREALAAGEVPVGAVIVKDGEIIGEGRNCREAKKLALSHAETEAINAANKAVGDWRLDKTTIYITLEPCLMCTGAICAARIGEVVFGAYDTERGFVSSRADINKLSEAYVTVFGGIKEDECEALLNKFFKEKRK
ncbi:MAG: nucleoside deaminase [Clostridia bacterium]|nr:nucleoside deaminase [Clostridia bacterium]